LRLDILFHGKNVAAGADGNLLVRLRRETIIAARLNAEPLGSPMRL
jgi:hypothetical protein